MSSKEKNAVRLLDTKLDAKTTKTMVICAVIMLVSVLIHDGDHIRQAVNWGYTIPLSLWALNLIVYVLPVVSLFLARSRRDARQRAGRHRHLALVRRAALLRLLQRPELGHLELYIF